MNIPLGIWIANVALAVITTGYGWLGKEDKLNYTDTISSAIGFVFWIITGYSFFIGIQDTGATGFVYYSAWYGLPFFLIAIATGLITWTKLVNIATEKAEEGKHVDMNLK